MSLQQCLKDEKARKIFGEKEREIIQKQLDGKKLTQSERNRLSRDIRTKFEFIKEVSKFEDEFELENNQNNKRLIGRAVKAILEHELGKEVKAILLFGSFADGTFIKRSDIDICVVFGRDLSSEKAFRFRIETHVPDKIDLQVFNELPQKIKRSIARNHKVLFQKSGFDDIDFSIAYMKDEDYFIRINKIFGVKV